MNTYDKEKLVTHPSPTQILHLHKHLCPVGGEEWNCVNKECPQIQARMRVCPDHKYEKPAGLMRME